MQKLTSRRFLITVLAIAFQLLPLFQPSEAAERAIVAVTVIAVVSIAGLNIEDWLWAKQAFAGNKVIQAALDGNKPPEPVPNPIIQSNGWPLFFLLLAAILIMRIGL